MCYKQSITFFVTPFLDVFKYIAAIKNQIVIFRLCNYLFSDKILNDMGSIFEVSNQGNKSYLKSNLENNSHNKGQGYGEVGFSANGNAFFGLFNAQASGNLAAGGSSEWSQSGKTLNEQVVKHFVLFFLDIRILHEFIIIDIFSFQISLTDTDLIK